MGLHTDGSSPGSTPAVRDAEGLVQVEVGHIGPEVPGAAEPHLSIHVSTVHVDLAPGSVHHLTYLGDCALEYPVGGGVGDHHGGQIILVGGHLFSDVLHVNGAVVPGLDGDNLDRNVKQSVTNKANSVRA